MECNFRCPGGGVGYPIDNIESHQCLLILLIDRQSDGFGWGGGGGCCAKYLQDPNSKIYILMLLFNLSQDLRKC